MPSVLALRALLGTGLGLGALDLVWINAALAPRLAPDDTAQAPLAATVTAPSNAPSIPTPDEQAPAPPPSEEAAPRATDARAPQADKVVTMRVYFDTGSAVLDARARKVLADLAEAASPDAMFVLEGHADHRGDERLNHSLSKDRAVSVQQQLVQLGVARARIRVGYVGEGEATGELWRDRRVDIQFTGGTR